MKTRWFWQYLDNEELYYLVEIHDTKGILSEIFFENKDELDKYIVDNAIFTGS